MLRDDRLDLARQHFEKVLTLDPDHLNAKHMLIRLHLKNQDYQTAEKQLKESIKRHPNDLDFYADLGFVYIQMQNMPEARKWLQKALAINPNHQKSQQLLNSIP